ncbi:DNA-binding response regulator [Phormidesmis priestleyi ULC007]|uniref:DNA-binding response regulator n=1 Tax=Phormidesmis priestleyi ULC007 TaxID=1920490 RepID=A0A2T1D4Q5_9CYAN|nr:response regulator transcription factor [Phormidesmis priestleyi]PSB15431.1 DNA-binding response regulator [Phormidesmis priestleyi ULC007]PZO46189.1 MAG: DNA-binding response regulator [Phormidesmis priestleyi]
MDHLRVLIIEDHDLTRIGLRSALQQREGVEVVGEARDAKTGLSLLRSVPSDVAIVDVGLPDMTGIELTQQFKRFQRAGEATETKILIMTMQDHEDTVLAAFAAGADSYCMKNATIDQLIEALKITAEGNAWIDPAIARVVLQQSQKTYANAGANPTSNTIAINGLSEKDGNFIPAYPLTGRELEVLALIVDGCSNAEISAKLYITVGTVKTHVRNILNKLGADDRTQVAVRALRTGLIR